MKKMFSFFLPLFLLAFLVSCPIPFPSFEFTGTGAISGKTALPSDAVYDSIRSAGGEFTFQTLFPVQVKLEIDLYDTDAQGSVQLLPLPPDSAEVNVSFTDKRGVLLFSGKVSAGGTLSTSIYLPSAPEDITLTVQADGFEKRSVVINSMVQYREVNRTMAMKRLPPDQRSAFRSAAGFDNPYPDPVINVPVITVAFEDLYGRARAGDADYNDFIASYSISETLDAEGRVISITVEAEAVRKWAGYDHRFGIRIDNYMGEATVSGTWINGSGVSVPFSSNDVEAPREIVLFERSSRSVGKSAGFTITFDDPQVIEDGQTVLSRPPYNPYIYVHNTTRDIHLIDGQPLSGSTNPDPDDRFVDDDGFPWALLVPSDWESPAEGQRIEEAYPRFENWRSSGGSEHGDWYNYPGEPYVPPDEEPVVYAAGFYNNGSRDIAAYWIDDGTEITRADLYTADNSGVADMFIDEAGNLYFAGYIRSGRADVASYWKNGSRTDLQSAGRATGIVVSEDGTVYISGYYDNGIRDVAVYWVDDGQNVVRRDLHVDSQAIATGISIGSGGSIYISGQTIIGPHFVAAYWFDTQGSSPLRTDLHSQSVSQTTGISVFNGDVYVSGRYFDGSFRAAIWKNDAAGLQTLNQNSAEARDVSAAEGGWISAGDYLSGTLRRAAFWQEGSQTDLEGSYVNAPSQAFSVKIFEDDIFISGSHLLNQEEAVYWINGELAELNPGVHSRAETIFVVYQ